MLREVGLLGQFAREGAHLAGRGDLSRQEEPEHGFGQHLGTGGTLRELLLTILDGLAVEADPLIGIKDRALPEHRLETTHTTNDIGNFDLTNHIVTPLFHLLEEFTFGGDDRLEGGLQIGFRRRIRSARGILSQ